MKKILLMIVPLMALIGCSYDDTDIQKRLDDLDGQLTELQALVKALNSDVTTLKELVAGKRFISDVQPGEEGGYVITLVTAAGETSTITISDGEDGTSSVIGVKQDSDGIYYWTLNGDFILDNGKKLPVSGATPEFKIENSHWLVSYDNGVTWTDCGQAQTDQNLFKSVATSEDGKLVYLTLADGTVLTFELYVQFGIAFDTTSATIRVGETTEIPFTLTGADGKTDIQTLADGAWKAEVKRTDNEGGTIAVTAPGDSSTGKVIVLVSDGDAKTLMRTLTFVSGVLNVSTSSKEATAAGGPVTVDVETDLDYTVAIPEAAKSWITQVETRGGEIRTETLTFNVAANTETQSRSAGIELIAGETVIETILIYQEAYYDPAHMVLKVEAKEYSSSTYNNKVYLPLYGAVDVTVNWGDGQSEQIAATISTAAAMPNHTYAESGTYHVTISGTAEKLYGKLINKTVAPAILEVRQWGKLGMTTMEYAFSNNTSLVTVPLPEEGAFAAVTSVENMFSGCTKLETVPEELLAGAPEVTSIASMFYGCTELKTVPERLFEKTTKATSAANLFSGCKALESVPAGLLADMPALTNLGSIFNNCASLKSIPETFFANQTEAESFSSGFSGCTALETLPADLFKNMKKVSNIASLFKGCANLESIPEGLLDSFTEVVNMTSLFSGCKMLGDLPDDIFKNMGKAKSGGYLYEGCISMTQFPSLKNCVSLEAVPAIWKDCTQLVEAPADYFPESVKKGISAAYIFSGCTALKTVPQGLFKDFESVTTISQMFLNCTSLESLPADIFDGMKKINSAGAAFSGCTAFTGESPYTMVQDGEQQVKVHLYERTNYPDIFGAKIFTSASSYKDTFKGCTQMADYADIPIPWGGISDGTKAKPTLTLTAAPAEGKEYYQLTGIVKSTEMKSGKVLCTTKALLPELIEQMETLEKVMNRYGNPISSAAVTEANSEAGATFYFSVDADTEYVFLASGTNAHGTTIEQTEVKIPAVPAGDADYERYIGTWTVTTTSSEINKQPQTYTVEITPYRTNESFRVKGWGITTLGDDYPFLLKYNEDGNVTIPTFDPQGMYGLTAYVYLRYHFNDPTQTPPYPIYTTTQELITGNYDTASNSVRFEGQKFTYNGTEYTVCGVEYAIYSSGQYVVWPDLFKAGYTLQDYAIGPYTMTKNSSAVSQAGVKADADTGIAPLAGTEMPKAATPTGVQRLIRK